jgi:hypothetical protein
MTAVDPYINKWKEDFSKAYVAAVAAQAGWKIGSWSQDKDLMDVILETSVDLIPPDDGYLSLKIDLQLKCTESPSTNNDKFVSFKIEQEHIERIRKRVGSDPFYFIPVHIPKSYNEWITHDTSSIIHPKTLLSYCGYFREILPFQKANRTIRFSKEHIFSHTFLEELRANRNTFNKINAHFAQRQQSCKNPIETLNPDDEKESDE